MIPTERHAVKTLAASNTAGDVSRKLPTNSGDSHSARVVWVRPIQMMPAAYHSTISHTGKATPWLETLSHHKLAVARIGISGPKRRTATGQ